MLPYSFKPAFWELICLFSLNDAAFSPNYAPGQARAFALFSFSSPREFSSVIFFDPLDFHISTFLREM